MAEFRMKIAGATGEITSLFSSTPNYFSAYRAEETPDFSVTVHPEDLRFEQAELDREAEEEGFRFRVFTDPFLERAAIQRAFAEYLIRKNVLLVHGSAIAVDGIAYLFVAKSGTGKSTHTRFWRELFGQRAVMVNDDKPFLELTDHSVIVHGSPWSGKHGLDTNIAVSLGGICFLERGVENVVSPVAADIAASALQKQTYIPSDPEYSHCAYELLTMLSQSVPLWHITCTKDPEAARIAYQGITGKEY